MRGVMCLSHVFRSCVILIFAVLVTSCGERAKQSEAMKNLKLNCPEGSQVEIDRWGGMGENGWLKACFKKHGKFTAWNGEVKRVEGEYVDGKENGTWKYWNQEGKLVKRITYVMGKEIKVEEVTGDT